MNSDKVERLRSTDKFRIQDDDFRFPSHHVAHFAGGGHLTRCRVWPWAFGYLCYLTHVKELALSLNPSSVLDIGCGEGRFLGMLPPSVRRRLGVDLSERAIRFARAFYPDVEFQVLDAAELQETFDLVVAIEVLEHIPDDDVDDFLRTLADRAKGGGHVILCVPTTVMPLVRKHYRHYDREVFERQLSSSKAPLRILSVDYVYARSKLVNFYTRLTINRFGILELYRLNRLVWRYVWKRLRQTTPERGQHLVVLLQKTGGQE